MSYHRKTIFHLNTTGDAFSCTDNPGFNQDVVQRANTLLRFIAQYYSIPISQLGASAARNEILTCLLVLLVEDFPHLKHEMSIWKAMINRAEATIYGLIRDSETLVQSQSFLFLKRNVSEKYRTLFPKPVLEEEKHSSGLSLEAYMLIESELVVPRDETVPFHVFKSVVFESMMEIFPYLRTGDLEGRSRENRLVFKRAMIYDLCRLVYGQKITLKEIGSLVNKDHATVINGLRIHGITMTAKGPYADMYRSDVRNFKKTFLKKWKKMPAMFQKISFIEGIDVILSHNVNLQRDDVELIVREIAMNEKTFSLAYFTHLADNLKIEK
ncbi:MAG: hypothetical protein KBC98_01955 [Candidatus Pacebacteria bacterium]|jgi:hypothetical protein|nr:hypothetical protein [Candidatus Paceibacterota bacterium]